MSTTLENRITKIRDYYIGKRRALTKGRGRAAVLF